MSGLRARRPRSARVTGSDRAESPSCRALARAGIESDVGHDAANVPAGDDVEVVVSTAIPADNPERAAARERGLRELPRAELLARGERAASARIAIAGTHGKTTTTAMTVHVLRAAAWSPAYLIGGELRDDRPQRRLGDGGVARRRGRRVRPLDAALARRGRGRDERRARPPRDVRLAGRGPRGLPRRSWPARPQARRVGPPRRAGAARRARTSRSTSPSRCSTPAARASRGAGTPCASRCPARTTPATPPPRSRPPCWPAPTRGRRRGARDFAGAGRRFELLGTTPRRRARRRRLRPPPDRGRRDARRRAHAGPAAGRRRLPAAPVLAHAAARARVRRRARAGRRRRRARRLPGARARRGLPGRQRAAVAEAAADAADGRRGALAAGVRRRRARAARAACATATCASSWARATSTSSGDAWSRPP